ncbi:MAG: 50S ribosomal protein L28 [Chloroflexi bacterium]|nr:50S ribosomal protein L28 [Chloroflexota bacterium]
MPAICDKCGKGTKFGRNIRHKSTGRWERKASRTRRTFKPNLQRHRVLKDGRKVRMRLCTRCLRTQLREIV